MSEFGACFLPWSKTIPRYRLALSSNSPPDLLYALRWQKQIDELLIENKKLTDVAVELKDKVVRL